MYIENIKAKIDTDEIHYEYNTRGYMMYYKGIPIGGAGIDRNAKGSSANLKLFRECADRTKRQMCAGYIDKYMWDEICRIDRGESV